MRTPSSYHLIGKTVDQDSIDQFDTNWKSSKCNCKTVGKDKDLSSIPGITNPLFYLNVCRKRKDGEKLIPEYKGKASTKLSVTNDEYSISGYHYDIKK